MMARSIGSPRIVPGLAWLGLIISLGWSSARAIEEDLQEYFDSLDSFQAEFVQEVHREGGPPDVSSGHVVLAKPRRFRWDYTTPYAQLVLADGDRLWHYDPDLEQATVRPLADALGQSPLAQLMSGARIGQLFRVEQVNVGDSEPREYLLFPVQAEAEFETVRLEFRNHELAALELVDALGQTTRVRFIDGVRNRYVPADTWEFEPPPGTDVVGDV